MSRKRPNQAITPRAPVRNQADYLKADARARTYDLCICAFLVAVVFLVYAPVTGYPFVNFDDDVYVYQNSWVNSGLSLVGLKWAFTSFDFIYWQPLTWISHMVDCEIFGLRPGAHHFENVLLHGLNALLVFLFLRLATGCMWQSAVASALFAVHPLRVESVAWIAERKDLLSGLFWLLTLVSYIRYARADFSWKRYGSVVLFFLLGLMSKPSLVSLPLILVLLDYWPLKRMEVRQRRVLILEKVPFIAFAAISSALTFYGQSKTGAITPLPISVRLANACIGYVSYLKRSFWPSGLSVMYTYETHAAYGLITFAIVLLVAITGAVIWFRKQRPYLVTGWLWFLAAPLPTIGIIQAGPQAAADRFTYIPSIGLCLIVAWFIGDQIQGWRYGRTFARIATGAGLATLALCSTLQVRTWKDGITLFSNAAVISPADALVQHNLGFALAMEGRYSDAIPHYREALRIDPHSFRAHYNLGRALVETGGLAEACDHFQRVLQLDVPPEYAADAHSAMGIALVRLSRLPEAESQFRNALSLKKSSPEMHSNLGSLLALTGRLNEAADQFEESIRLNPKYVEGHRNLAHTLASLGKLDAAKAEYSAVLGLSPDNRDAQEQFRLLQSR